MAIMNTLLMLVMITKEIVIKMNMTTELKWLKIQITKFGEGTKMNRVRQLIYAIDLYWTVCDQIHDRRTTRPLSIKIFDEAEKLELRIGSITEITNSAIAWKNEHWRED